MVRAEKYDVPEGFQGCRETPSFGFLIGTNWTIASAAAGSPSGLFPTLALLHMAVDNSAIEPAIRRSTLLCTR